MLWLCLIVGGGPCGLRTAIELAYLGAKVVVVEKRDTFSRNNVLHLWPFTIHDLRGLGAKKFYGKFCAGSIDHISIRQLQLILFKVALMLGVEIHVNVEFVRVLEPPEDQENQKVGWRAEFLPADHALSDFEFDVIIGADGNRNTLEGFRRKEFRGKLAIAITANFINRNSTAEAKVEEISGVAFIFNQKFFQDLKEETGIDLENIVYYKDCTHYFVMTAKKQSLLDKGVIINDYIDTEMLLCTENVNQDNLLSYAREAADFATNYQLPSLDFAINHNGQPDVAMFDFTSMYASENAALMRERQAHQLLVALVGDSLLEPFWPMGTGCARGFLAAFDTAWMVKSWDQGTPPLEVLAERESLYRLLPQTTPENINKNFEQYTLDPATRYPNLNLHCVRPHQVKHLYITKELDGVSLEGWGSVRRSVSLSRRESDIRPNKLLTWCQQQTEGYQHVHVTDLTTSWRSGLALCAIIHRFRPELINFDSLNEDDAVENNQLAFDVAKREFGILPVTTGKEMASTQEPDKLSMVMYLSKFYELFRGTPLRPMDSWRKNYGENADFGLSKSFIPNNYLNLTFPRKRTPRVDTQTEENDMNKRRRQGSNNLEELPAFSSRSLGSIQECARESGNQNKVKSMANQLLAKFEESTRNPAALKQLTVGKVSSGIGAAAEVLVNLYLNDHRRKTQATSPDLESVKKAFPLSLGGSDTCYFCKKRVYVMERLSAEGHFFHRECFRCSVCATTLRLAAYAFDCDEGKFYCKPHFIHCKTNSKQRKRRAELKQQGEEEGTWQEQEAPRRDTPTESSCAVAAISTPEGSPPGISTSFFRKALSWPFRLTRGLLDLPRSLLRWMQGLLNAAGHHVRDNAHNYCFTVEVLSMGLLLLWAFSEVLAVMYRESEESLESIRTWLLRFIPVKLHSDTESDYGDTRALCAKACEERPQLPESPPPSKPPTRHVSLREPLTRPVSLQYHEEPQNQSALLRTHSLQSPVPSKYQNWRRKFQSSSTSMNRRTPSPPLPPSFSSSSSLSSSFSSISEPGHTSDNSSPPQVPAYNLHSLPVSRGGDCSPTPLYLRRARALGMLKEIPLYLPHGPMLESTGLVSPAGESFSNCPEMASEDYQEAPAHLGSTKSMYEDFHPIAGKDQYLYNQNPTLRTARNPREVNMGPRRDQTGAPQPSEERKLGLKKLVLTPEQKTMLLDWSDSTPEHKAGKQFSQERDENGRSCTLKPFSSSPLPWAVKEKLLYQTGAQEEMHTPAIKAPREREVPPPKSPLRLIANAILKSLRPNSEGGKKTSPKPESKTSPRGQPHGFTRSFSLRKPSSNKDGDQQSPGRHMAFKKASAFFSLASPTSKTAQASDFSLPDPLLRSRSLPSRPYKMFFATTSPPPSSKIEDVPTLLEKVSLQDGTHFPKIRASRISNLGLKDKSFESFLQECKQRKDIGDFFTSPKEKGPPRNRVPSLEKLVQPLGSTSLGQVAHPSTGQDARLGALVTEATSSPSSTTSSSADEDFDSQLSSKLKRMPRRRRKLERKLVRQEELKRLHKAQAIQRQLEEVEERQRTLEIQGVKLEKVLRGEAADSGTQDEAQLLQEWFKLVLEKNKLMRYESELLIIHMVCIGVRSES
ncbi:protein MICAL-2-like protein [Cricetulus griseus]|nr:protein MICAL-2-like protein [Cricetulus griseus]